MLSLERLEQMNRRAILWSFPLLTAGLLGRLRAATATRLLRQGLDSLRMLSVLGLWLVFAILLYLRYRVHVRGRQVALWTMFAFVILVLALVSPRTPSAGGRAMNLLVVGGSFKTVPIELREKLAFDGPKLTAALAGIDRPLRLRGGDPQHLQPRRDLRRPQPAPPSPRTPT